jgi:hypothetical protein
MSQNLEDRNEFASSSIFKKMFQHSDPEKNPESDAINNLDKLLSKIPKKENLNILEWEDLEKLQSNNLR